MVSKCTKYKCWCGENYHFQLVNNSLIVNMNLPTKYKWVRLIDANQTEHISKIYKSDSCKCKLGKLPKGKYYVFLYSSNNGFSFEAYIGGKQIVLELDSNGEWSFVLPVYAKWNIDLIKNGNLKYVYNDTILFSIKTTERFALMLTRDCKTDRDKVLKIHDFVAGNLYYDYDILNSGASTNLTIEQIVREKKCVCQGFADLTLVLLKSLNFKAENILCYAIPNIFEEGWSNMINRRSDINHIITRVKVDGKWLYMDVTWDSGNKFIDGVYITGEVSHTYYDMTIAFLSSTHRFFKIK